MEKIISFDFGNDFVPHDPGYVKIERLYYLPAFMWVNEMSNRWFAEEQPSPFRDILYGNEGEFRMGLPEGTYRLQLHFYDPDKKWDPFTVQFGTVKPYEPRFSGHILYTKEIQVMQGEVYSLTAELKHPGGIMAVGFPGAYFISGMDVYGPSGTTPEPVYEEAPLHTLPNPCECTEGTKEDCEAMLRKICDWFLDNRLPDGFIGDFEEGKRLWYTSSYPIRTLLAGYDLFGTTAYLDAAVHILDLLVSEQMPEGGFTQVYRSQPTDLLTPQELDAVRQSNWMNLADVGSMAAALAMACFYVDGTRRHTYIRSVRRYLDDWAILFRQSDGGFSNGWTLRMDEKVYNVSTAASALTFALFYVLTKEEVYLHIAEDAALLLTDKWNDDGRLWNHIYNGTYPGRDHYQDVREFGDGFYTLEAVLALLNISPDLRVKENMFAALRKYLFGSNGLLALKKDASWWELQNCWHNSKSAGNPAILCDFLRYGKQFGLSHEERILLEKEYQLCRSFLSSPAYAGLLGILCPEPLHTYPFARHSIQCWNGCAAAAGGFAGIALAHMLSPGIIFAAGFDTERE